jgi:hypothetical protein
MQVLLALLHDCDGPGVDEMPGGDAIREYKQHLKEGWAIVEPFVMPTCRGKHSALCDPFALGIKTVVN